MNAGKNRMGANAQGLAQVGQRDEDVETYEGDQISVIESILVNTEGETLPHLQSYGAYQKSLLEKRAMSDFLIDRWERKLN